MLVLKQHFPSKKQEKTVYPPEHIIATLYAHAVPVRAKSIALYLRRTDRVNNLHYAIEKYPEAERKAWLLA